MGGRERRRKPRRERRDRAVHQADQPWLDELQNEAPLLVLVFAAAGRGGQDLLLEPGGDLVVLLLLLGEVAEQLAGRSIGGARQGLSIEARRGALHLARMRPHGLDAQRPLMPHWLHRDVTADVIAPHQGNMIAEFRHEEVDEPAPAPVLLLVAYRKSQDLALGQVIELAHGLRLQDSRLVDWLRRGPLRRRALEGCPFYGCAVAGVKAALRRLLIPALRGFPISRSRFAPIPASSGSRPGHARGNN